MTKGLAFAGPGIEARGAHRITESSIEEQSRVGQVRVIGWWGMRRTILLSDGVVV